MKNSFGAVLVLFLLLCLAPWSAFADAGVLLPMDKQQPDPSILSLDEMQIDIKIDNGVARVFVRQVFANHTNRIEEGNYVFALPSRATVSDFATWDGTTRLPAVILERKRAEEIYNSLKQQQIDPGLLQMGERGADEARNSAVFSAKITPIPRYGTKRLEIEYHENIPVENLKSYFAIALKPDAYRAQAAGKLWINFELMSAHPIRNFRQSGTIYPLKVSQNDDHTVKGSFAGNQISLTEDFTVTYEIDPAGADTLQVITHRQPESGQPDPTVKAPIRSANEPGFFAAKALIAQPSAREGGAAKTVIVLFDTSLSVQWEKLERSFFAMETLLRSLKPEDRFNLVLFNDKASAFKPTVVGATSGTVTEALAFVRGSRLRGGTDLQTALEQGLTQSVAAGEGANAYIVLLSDGGATRGIVQSGKLSKWYEGKWKQIPATQRPKTYIFAVGDDANLNLLRMLARNDGVLENVLSTEDNEFKLNAFLSKIGRSPVGQLQLQVEPAGAVKMVYPLQESAFSGSMAAWVGQYTTPTTQAQFSASGGRDGQPFALKKSVPLPERSAEHAHLPRLWARARVDALLEKIERDGEDRATIDEIIRLARKYKFVTPYTSFLAVPRSLLRPRVIRPGDPVLRVRTDESITSVIAMFPFGLTKPLRYLATEDIWQTRFLAPKDMADGTYNVTLILRDRNNNTYREQKSFVIASKPPTVRINLARYRYRRGEVVEMRVDASANTRTLVARLEGAAPVSLRWDRQAKASTGRVPVPHDLPVGQYKLTVIAEDMAHNIGTQEVQLEIVP
jgi:Ca-activated chloride channel family protein